MTKEEKLFIATGEKIKDAKVRCLEKLALKSMEKHLHDSLKSNWFLNYWAMCTRRLSLKGAKLLTHLAKNGQ